jgi:hypothetical protein
VVGTVLLINRDIIVQFALSRTMSRRHIGLFPVLGVLACMVYLNKLSMLFCLVRAPLVVTLVATNSTRMHHLLYTSTGIGSKGTASPAVLEDSKNLIVSGSVVAPASTQQQQFIVGHGWLLLCVVLFSLCWARCLLASGGVSDQGN